MVALSRLIRKNISRGIDDSILLDVPDLNLSNFVEQELIQLKNRAENGKQQEQEHREHLQMNPQPTWAIQFQS